MRYPTFEEHLAMNAALLNSSEKGSGGRMNTEDIDLKVCTPGSDAARKRGCKCPVMDNQRGKGALEYGDNAFWINGSCPLHGDFPDNGEEE